MPNEIEQPATGAEIVTPTATVKPTASATPAIQPDTAAAIQLLTEERDAANARIRELNRENQKHRTTAEQTSATLETERAKIEALLKHGTPDEILAAIEERNTLKTERAEAEARVARDTTLSQVAKDANADKDVLAQLDRAGLEYETKEEKKNNGVEKVVYVKNGDAAPQPFDEFFKAFLPSLRPAVAPRPGALPAPTPSNDAPGAPQKPRPLGFL